MSQSPLEPAAITENPDPDLRVQTSIAISLKRIADALEAANAKQAPEGNAGGGAWIPGETV